MPSQYDCNHCEMVFKHRHHLLRHKRSKHASSSGTFPCELCDAVYSRQEHLGRHMDAVHNGSLHVCGICQKDFNRADNLRRHQSNCGIPSLKCPRCHDMFPTKDERKAHMALCPFPTCNGCDSVFVSKNHYDKHECTAASDEGHMSIKTMTKEERLKEIRRILERLQSAPSIALASYEICQEDPGMISAISVLASRAKQNNIIEKMLRRQTKAAGTNWLPWQEELKSELDGEPHDRKNHSLCGF